MKNVLLISENFLRTNFQISENLQSQFIIPAIRNAQFIKYQTVVGECLYNRLLEGVEEGDLTDEEKLLLEHSKMFIAYSAIAELCEITSFKINNIGVNQTGDDRVTNYSVKDVMFIKQQFINHADFYLKDLQNFLLNHRDDYPELSECQCRQIKKNLYSAASCGVNLGGARGKYGK